MAKKKRSKKPTVKERKKVLEQNQDESFKKREKEKVDDKTVDKKLTKEEKKQEKLKSKEIKKADKEKIKREKKEKQAIVGKGTMRQELKKVTWPTAQELSKSTLAVIFVIILTALIIFFSDLIFGALSKEFSKQVKKRQQHVEEVVEDEQESQEEQNEVSEEQVE